MLILLLLFLLKNNRGFLIYAQAVLKYHIFKVLKIMLNKLHFLIPIDSKTKISKNENLHCYSLK